MIPATTMTVRLIPRLGMSVSIGSRVPVTYASLRPAIRMLYSTTKSSGPQAQTSSLRCTTIYFNAHIRKDEALHPMLNSIRRIVRTSKFHQTNGVIRHCEVDYVYTKPPQEAIVDVRLRCTRLLKPKERSSLAREIESLAALNIDDVKLTHMHTETERPGKMDILIQVSATSAEEAEKIVAGIRQLGMEMHRPLGERATPSKGGPSSESRQRASEVTLYIVTEFGQMVRMTIRLTGRGRGLFEARAAGMDGVEVRPMSKRIFEGMWDDFVDVSPQAASRTPQTSSDSAGEGRSSSPPPAYPSPPPPTSPPPHYASSPPTQQTPSALSESTSKPAPRYHVNMYIDAWEASDADQLGQDMVQNFQALWKTTSAGESLAGSARLCGFDDESMAYKVQIQIAGGEREDYERLVGSVYHKAVRKVEIEGGEVKG